MIGFNKNEVVMKLIYVADNRCRTNFGCRGTSIALSQLISKEHEIVATVSGAYTHEGGGPIFFIPGLPGWIYLLAITLPGWNFLKKGWLKLVGKRRRLYRFFDFVSESPKKSICNLQKCLPANPHLQEFDLRRFDFEGIVINGEGTMIMTTPPRRESLVFLMFIEWAKLMDKKVYFVNAMFSDCPATGSNKRTKLTMHEALKKSDVVTARDPVSQDYISQNFTDIKAEYIPDALFTWMHYIDQIPSIVNGCHVLPFGQEDDNDFEKFVFSNPYICVSGSSLAAWNQKKAYDNYKFLVTSFKQQLRIPLYLIQVCSGDKFLVDVGRDTGVPCIRVEISILAGTKILSDAALYISGRFHPSIMASLGGTPCIFLGSNSHKTWSLQKMLEYDHIKEFSAIPSVQETPEIIALAKEKLRAGKLLRSKIRSVVSQRSADAFQLAKKII